MLRGADAPFTLGEKARLWRNAGILFLFAAAAVAFAVCMSILTDLAPGLKILACALCLLLAIPVFLYFLRYVRDLIKGDADVYVGVVTGKREASNGDAPMSHFITVGTLEHQVGYSMHRRVKVGDRVIIRKAPKSHFVVNVTVD